MTDHPFNRSDCEQVGESAGVTKSQPGASNQPSSRLGPSGTAIFSPQLDWLNVNDQLCEMLGYKPEALMQLRWQDIVHPDQHQQLADLLDAIQTGQGQSDSIDLRVIRSDGVPRAAYVSVTGIRKPDGSLESIIAVILDITDHTRNQRVLSSRVKLSALAEHTTSQGLLQAFLDEAEQLTDSCLGYFQFLDEDEQSVNLQVWSTKTHQMMCRLVPEAKHYPIAAAGVWLDCVRQRRSVMHNNCEQSQHSQGLSEGHAPVKRELVVPVFRNGTIVAILGVGNKPTNYLDEDEQIIRDLADLAWDIVSRKRAEESLCESEARFRGTFEQAAVGVALVAPDGRFLRINQRFSDIVSYEKQELEGLTITAITHPDDHDTDLEYIQRALTGEISTYSREKRCIRKDGRTVWITMTVSLIRKSDGQPDYFVGIIQDITNRKQTEAALRESEQRFRTVTDFTHDWEYWVSPEGQLLYVSPACSRVTGYSADAFITNPSLLNEIIHLEDRNRAYCVLNDIQADGPRKSVFRIMHTDGEVRWVEHMCQPVFDAKGHFIGRRASNRDITTRIQAELEREQLQRKLNQAQKLEAVGTLAAGVAHDFNNSLTAIIGHAELARDESSNRALVIQNVEGVLTAAKRAAGIARSLLTFSRETPAQMGPVNLGQFVTESARMLERMLPAIIDIHIDARPEDHHWISADAVQLNQILMNLVVNARDAMVDGGQLTIRVSHESVDDSDRWALMPQQEHGVVTLSVSDTGTGMTDEVVSRIYNPFFTTKPREEGTGLGMSVVHGIVESHGGQLHIETAVGQGTRVSIGFPAATAQQMISAVEVAHQRRGNIIATALVADDNEQVRTVITRSLEEIGCQVIQASDGPEALRTFDKFAKHLDLVVLDIDMPKMRGTTCLEHMRQTSTRLPAILISGFRNQDVENHFSEPVKFLFKPFRMQEVTELAYDMLCASRQSGALPMDAVDQPTA
jgi:two-component system cell cycle sensor histidine kinase/response regulator CckA